MKKEKKYNGIVVPAITPLTTDYKLDEGSVENIFRNFRQQHVDAFILGTTGESASLPVSVKTAYIKKAVALKQPGEVLYAGVSSNCLEETVEFSKFCFDAGVDVVAATLPTYYALTEMQMKKYFEEVADQLPGPLIIYNIPATTHMSIPLHVIDQLSYHEKIVGTKDSERSDERLEQSLELWSSRQDFSHFLGWAAKSADALIRGSDGLIPSSGNLFPFVYKRMLQAVRSGDKASAFQWQQFSDQLGDVYQKGKTLGQSLAALKCLMKEYNLCERWVMPPLQLLPPEEEASVIAALNDIVTKEEIEIEETIKIKSP
jgi:dihydrodipicolinate synthase/N-acetylneuraminate lyase